LAGLLLSRDSASADGRGLATARFPGYHLSFRYPSAWQRKDWCWSGEHLSPITLLTTVKPAPDCTTSTPLIGVETPFPPPQGLGSNGLAAWWYSTDRAPRVTPNAQVDGRPARITVRTQRGRRAGDLFVACVGPRAGHRFLSAQIRGASSSVPQVRLDAVICGPDFASGEAEVRQMLASARLTR